MHASARQDTPVSSAVTTIRWWAACAFGRTALARSADRVQAWAVVAGLLVAIAATYPAAAAGQLGYASRSQDIAAQAATHHPVEATALGNSTPDPALSESTSTESTSTTFQVHVGWTAQNVSHDAMTKIEQPVKAGAQVRIWLDDKGKLTTAPPTAADARVDAIGTAVLAWMAMVLLIGGALAVLRSVLGRSRNREWDRGLRELVDNGGGSTTPRS
jgi:hypothetical protein